MTMKILIVEDEPSLARCYRRLFEKAMPDARIDVVGSAKEYAGAAAETEYDAYVMDNDMDTGKAFRDIAPAVWKKFPGAIILHNSSRDTGTQDIADAEELGFRFARGPDGKVVTCLKQFPLILEFIKTMVVCREDARQKPAFAEKMPACQSMRSHAEPKAAFRCCRP